MSKKILVAIFAVFFILLGVFLYVWRIYDRTEFYPLFECEGSYTWNGTLLRSSDDDSALLYRPLERRFEPLTLTTVELSPYGFEGSRYSYYASGSFFYPFEEAYRGFRAVSSPEKFIFTQDSKKYEVDLQREKAYAMFSGSVEGVEAEGSGVLGFSTGGVYALSLEDGVATVFVSDEDPDSLKIKELFTLDLSSFGEEITFKGFVNEKNAWFIAGDSYVVIDCSSREAVLSALDRNKSYGAFFGNFYLERENTEKEKQNEKKLTLGWSHVLLGTEFRAKLPKKDYASASLYAVSPQGKYCAALAKNSAGETEFLVASQKKVRSLSKFLPGVSVEDLFFIEENVLFLNLRGADGKAFSASYRICY